MRTSQTRLLFVKPLQAVRKPGEPRAFVKDKASRFVARHNVLYDLLQPLPSVKKTKAEPQQEGNQADQDEKRGDSPAHEVRGNVLTIRSFDSQSREWSRYN